MGNQKGADEENPPLGWAMRLIQQNTVYSQTAHKLLQALIEHSPSPETVAKQVLSDLGKCENPAVASLGDAVSTYVIIYVINKFYAQVGGLNDDRSVSPDDWAAAVNNKLKEKNSGNISLLTNLAKFYLTHLVIACRVQCNICWP
jgi:hypothetical protein